MVEQFISFNTFNSDANPKISFFPNILIVVSYNGLTPKESLATNIFGASRLESHKIKEKYPSNTFSV